MPDYSSYFRIKNYTDAPLELLWKNKPVKGHWLDDTIPGVIYPNTEVTITLKDDFGFDGSEGTIAYAVKWPHHPPCNIVFGMRLPYNATEGYPSISWVDIQCDAQEVLDIEQGHPPRTNAYPITAFYTIRYRENIPLKVNLKKITLPGPLFPVLMEDGLCPNFAIDHPLWSAAEAGKAIAATTCMNSTPKIKLVGNVDLKIRQFKLKMIGECTDNGHSSPATSIEFDLPVDQNTGNYKVLVPLALNNTHPGIPWGFRGTISWKVLVKNTGKFIPVTTSPIEIYAVSRALHRFLAVEGIPLDLLRFIVLPTRNWPKAGAGGVTNYVEYVVKRIHGESGFKYETTLGGTSYASLMASGDLTRPGSFQLAKWLKNQKITSEKDCHVNCYDLAAIVGICLGFFFPDNYEDRSQGLRWFEMFPFGFVEGDLVGWGQVNSPFFQGNKALMKVDRKDPKRTSFKRHIFITYNGKVLDATCGPRTGTLTLNEYIAKAIDHTEGLGKDLDWYKNGPGTFSSIFIHSSMADQGGSNDFNQISRENDGDANFEETDPAIEEVIEAVTGDKNRPKDTKGDDLIVYFNVNKLMEEMQSTFKGSFKIDGQLYHQQINEFKDGGHHVCWKLDFKDTKNKTHPVNLDIFMSTRTFTSRLALRRFMRLSNNPCNGEVKETKSRVKYQLEEGALLRAYWVYGTLCVNLSAPKGLGHDAFVNVVEGLQKFLEKNDSSEKTKVSVGEPVFNKEQQKDLKVGKTMKVGVNVERAVEFKWSYGYGNVVVVGVEKPSGVSNIYTFELCARTPGFDRVAFTFVDEFYREQSAIFYVNVEP
ncbi:uncharacterized protein LAJ45_03030 [Morchella importuna]|uniref:uncharacterized protein n=1 Tax=Morchella importuna TaxID=1174673 RepID=UPI001E8DB48A|nr:uncharacterized protein LAJ45_03030 [Morchella importuna]KAH8152805.1 hypothetical protein LAJ45_03030 [Morchella importuna]